MEMIKELVNSIRHVLVNESFNLFARNNVIDVDLLSDTVREANRMAGFSMMSDEFQEQVSILMKIDRIVSAILLSADDNDEIFAQYNEMLKPYGFDLKDVKKGEFLPWTKGQFVSEPVIAQVGTTLLVCKPYTFIIGRFS